MGLKALKNVAHRVLDFLYPPLCVHCSAPAKILHGKAPSCLCLACMTDCVPIAYTRCNICGIPALSAKEQRDEVCSSCKAQALPYLLARSAFFYRESGPLRSVISMLKNRMDAALTEEIGLWMREPTETVILALQKPMLCPVPIHWLRRQKRGYNQALHLAIGLQKQLGLEITTALVRPFATSKQKGGKQERFARLQGVFQVVDPALIKGKSIVLVDDVFTTGATAFHAAQTLREAGALAVGVVTLARVSIRTE